ncbi:tetratricopeptide repeat protein [Botrimarina sp.]|uniref:tetratricopeptide repeat protein n=1 Tax=Botrimarina sp. TaxID=2795802 RepID=UPI0032EF797C
MLRDYLQPALKSCALALGVSASTALGQGAVYVGDLGSIDRAVLQQAASPVQAKYPPGLGAPPAAPARQAAKPSGDDSSFLSKLKPSWLFGDKEDSAPPADPFAAAASQARRNVARAGAQPIAVSAPAADRGVTPAAYNANRSGGPAMREPTQRSGGLLSGLWSGGSKQAQPAPSRSGSYSQWSRHSGGQPAAEATADASRAIRSKLRPGSRSAETSGPPASIAASRPTPSAPQRAVAQHANPRATGPSAIVPIRTPAPARLNEPAGGVVMISDDDSSSSKVASSKAPPSKAPSSKAQSSEAPSSESASDTPSLIAAHPAAAPAKPSAPTRQDNPFVKSVSEPMPLVQATDEAAPNKLAAKPSIIAAVEPLTKVVTTDPELEELPPYPTAPQADAGEVVRLPELSDTSADAVAESKPEAPESPEAPAAEEDLAIAVAVGPAAPPVAAERAIAGRSSFGPAPRPQESTRFAHGPSGDLAPLVEEARSTEPTERSRTLLTEAHQIASAAATLDDYSAVIKRCRYVLAIDDSPLAKQYANSLAGWALTKRGDLFDEEGRYDESQSDYHEALRCDPECWRAEHSLGVAAAREGDLATARVRFDRTLDLNPEYAKAYSNRAALAVQEGDFLSALADYGRAIEVDPDLAVAHNGRGRVCHMLGRLDEGLRHLDAAELLSPDDAMVATGRADLLVDLGNYGQALAAYKRAIEIDSQAPSAYRNLAWMLATCPVESFRDGEAAVRFAEQAEQLSSGLDDLLLDTKAAALAAAGRYDEAAETLRKAIDLAPETDAGAYRERLALYEQGESFISQPAAIRQASYQGGAVR